LILFSRRLFLFVNGRFRERWKWGRRCSKGKKMVLRWEMAKGKMMVMWEGD
jgi:hypothetical protein